MISIVSPVTHSARIRTVTNWSIEYSLFDKDVNFRINGIVTAGINEVPLSPGANARITRTSPIVKIQEKTLITESGSKYYLLNPSDEYLRMIERQGEVYQGTFPVTLKILEKLYNAMSQFDERKGVPVLWPEILHS